MAITSLSASHVFALASASDTDGPRIVVRTDRTEYYPGEKAIIFGNVSSDILTEGQSVVLLIYNPLGALARSDLIYPAPNGTFSYELPLGGRLMMHVGDYTVVTTYLGAYQSGTKYSLSSGGGDYLCQWTCVYELHFNNNTYYIEYRIEGIIENITVDVETKSLTIDAVVYPRYSGLEVNLPKSLIDATALDDAGQSRNANFTVLANGIKATSNEIAPSLQNPDRNYDYRVLLIEDLMQGENRIEIIGTWVSPEFGIVALLIVAATFAIWLIFSRSTDRKVEFR